MIRLLLIETYPSKAATLHLCMLQGEKAEVG